MTNSWISFSNLPSATPAFKPDTMLLLTDGTVLVHNTLQNGPGGAVTAGREWYRLTPDDNGDYDSGTWSGPFNMATARQFFASAVLKDGRLFVLGGEYSSAGNDNASGEIFDPQTKAWSTVTTPFNWINGDAASAVLADGRVIFGALLSSRTAIWDPANDVWEEAGLAFGTKTTPSKQGVTDEESWTLLSDGTVLTVQISATPRAEKYDPSQDLWINADQPTPTLTQPLALMSLTDTTVSPPKTINIEEIGPALVLPGGKLFAVGATGHTAIYTPPASPSQPGSWSNGPDLPADTSGATFNSVNGNLQTAIDAPAVLLPGGKVLVVAGNTVREQDPNTKAVSFWSNPTNVYVYDPVANTTPALLSSQPPSNGNDTWTARFLLLPNGCVLLSGEQAALAMFKPDSSLVTPDPSWKPVITHVPAAMVPGDIYTITGRQFNGLSQASTYGDDAQMATNYPLVSITNVATGVRRYLRTFNHSTMALATGSQPVSTHMSVPANTPLGDYQLVVIANGIASEPVTITMEIPVAAADSPVPATTRFGVEQLDVFWLEQGGAVWTGAADPTVNDGAWQDLRIVGSGAAAPGSPLTALTRYGKQLDVFWIAPDGSVQTATADPAVDIDNWHVAPVTGAGVAALHSPLAVTTRFDAQQLGVFWFGADGAVWTAWADPNIDSGAWHSFAITDPGAADTDSPLTALTRYGKQLDVFWIAPNGSLHTAYADPGIDNDSWQVLAITAPGLAATDSPLAVTTRFDVEQLDAFWLGGDGTVWTGFADPNILDGIWQVFPIPGAAGAASGSPVTALTRYDKQLDVFWITDDGTIWTAFADPGIDNDSWHAFSISAAGVAAPNSPLAVTTRFGVEQLDAFWLADDRTVWTAVADPNVNNGDWQVPFALPGAAAAAADSPVTALTRYGIQLDVFWIANDRTIWTAFADPNIGSGSWHAFAIT